MRGRARYGLVAALLLALCLFGGTCALGAQEGETGGQAGTKEEIGQEFKALGIEDETEKIQQFLDRELNRGQGEAFSFGKLAGEILSGDLGGALGQAGLGLKNSLMPEVEKGGRLMAQVAAIGLAGALFSHFSSVFKGGQVSETGFFAAYLLMVLCLGASFFESLTIAARALSQILEFVRLLMPAYFIAVAFAGGSVSAVALYEAMMAAVTGVQWVCLRLLLPAARVYGLFVLAGHLAREDVLSRFRELLEQAAGWALKTMMGLVLGFHVLQGMVLPYADSAGQAGLRRLIEMIPGLGAGAGLQAQLLLGAGVLIKNTMGAAALVVLLILAAAPAAKLAFLMALCQLAAALMEPVCDKRMTACVAGISRAHRLLLRIVASSLMLLGIAIAITCAATNVNYYTA